MLASPFHGYEDDGLTRDRFIIWLMEREQTRAEMLVSHVVGQKGTATG